MDRITTLTSTGSRAATAAAPPLARGATLGRYVVLDLLGSGAMGVVYRAYDFGLDRGVCLKLVALGPGPAAARRQERLIAEARAVARLNHPNVVAVYDVGTCDGQVFVAMELVEGRTLRDWLRVEDRPAKEILRVFLDAARGLEAAHAAGLVHRDFKPDNVLVGVDGRVRIADFGLALAAAAPDADGGGGGSGTPVYMAPEQHRRERVTAAADQYAFAVALQEALSGARPFLGSTEPALLEAKLQRRLCAGPRPVPRHLAAALERALAPDPAVRFPSMGAFVSALGRAPRWSLPAVTGVSTAALAAALFFTAPPPDANGDARVEAGPSRSASVRFLAEDAPRARPRGRLAVAGPAEDPFPSDTDRVRDPALASLWSPDRPGAGLDPWSGVLVHEAPATPPRRTPGAEARPKRSPRQALRPLVAFLETAELDALAEAVRDWLDEAASAPAFAGLAPVGDDAAAFRALAARGEAPVVVAPRAVTLSVAATEATARLRRIEELEAKLAAASTPAERAQTQFLLAQELWESETDRERAIALARQAQLTLTLDGRTATDLLDDVTDWLDENGLRGRGGTAF